MEENAPTIYEYISDDDKKHFDAVCNILNNANIEYMHDEKLVRGLDYYTRTTFEIKSQTLLVRKMLYVEEDDIMV